MLCALPQTSYTMMSTEQIVVCSAFLLSFIYAGRYVLGPVERYIYLNNAQTDVALTAIKTTHSSVLHAMRSVQQNFARSSEGEQLL